ncbi:hypothetical protein BKP56_09340 [Marinilactibacillus sp. 15R]|uniref:hypothetical protein n=1 Tax=Marinilactibacillus sp. 15R TaxID=1911586 RepID=UPI000909E687|nr:hypothetical protein [Marinilactibacillus sp. 15R]API89445.1 hypothetical protein BKP56_09340 [Marinilactibacillus sp. 15R]
MNQITDNKEITAKILYSEDSTLMNYLEESLNIAGDNNINKSRNINLLKNLEVDIKSIAIARMDRIISGYELFNQIAVVFSLGITVFTFFIDKSVEIIGLDFQISFFLFALILGILWTGLEMLKHKKKIHSAIYIRSILKELKNNQSSQ